MDKTCAERQKIIAAVMEWQEPAAWKIAFDLGAQFRKHKASVAQNRELARKYPSDPIWTKAADRDEEVAEIYRQQAVQFHGELLAIANYLRRNEPDLLPLVPAANFLFDDPPADVLPLAERMRQIESALRARLAQGGGAAQSEEDETSTESTTPRKARRWTKPREAEPRLIAALLKHHQYGDSGGLNLKPIRTRELAELAGVSIPRTWKFLTAHFRRLTDYRGICSRPNELAVVLQLLASRLATAQQLPYSDGRASHPGEGGSCGAVRGA
jgi:hypothetical protein